MVQYWVLWFCGSHRDVTSLMVIIQLLLSAQIWREWGHHGQVETWRLTCKDASGFYHHSIDVRAALWAPTAVDKNVSIGILVIT